MAENRIKITLACSECESRNYDLTKNRTKHPERVEYKKYCSRCRKHTAHKETK
jgi:large subunit ribosomal protein L33